MEIPPATGNDKVPERSVNAATFEKPPSGYDERSMNKETAQPPGDRADAGVIGDHPVIFFDGVRSKSA